MSRDQSRVQRKTGQPASSSTAMRGGFAPDTPAMLAQRKQIENSFGSAAQLVGQDEELQMKAADEELQMKAPDEEMQLKAPEDELPAQRKSSPGAARPAAQLEEAAAAPNQTGLPDNLKSGIESLSGMDMSDVRVHTGSAEPAKMNALAYAQGSDIHLAPGQEQHLPHEAWHVVQQSEGRVKPTTEIGGTAVNDDPGLESEADAMGSKALQMAGASDKTPRG